MDRDRFRMGALEGKAETLIRIKNNASRGGETFMLYIHLVSCRIKVGGGSVNPFYIRTKGTTKKQISGSIWPRIPAELG